MWATHSVRNERKRNGAPLQGGGPQMTDRRSWHSDERSVAGLHLANMLIWVLQLLPLLPMDGCWYFVSALRNLCSIHLRHLRFNSACTWWTGRERLANRMSGVGGVRDGRDARAGNEGLNGIKGQQTQQSVFLCLLTSPFKKQ